MRNSGLMICVHTFIIPLGILKRPHCSGFDAASDTPPESRAHLGPRTAQTVQEVAQRGDRLRRPRLRSVLRMRRARWVPDDASDDVSAPCPWRSVPCGPCRGDRNRILSARFLGKEVFSRKPQVSWKCCRKHRDRFETRVRKADRAGPPFSCRPRCSARRLLCVRLARGRGDPAPGPSGRGAQRSSGRSVTVVAERGGAESRNRIQRGKWNVSFVFVFL